MKKVLFGSGLGVIFGSFLGLVISIYGPQSDFGFARSDPEVFSLSKRELAIYSGSMLGGLAGMWAFGIGTSLFIEASSLKQLAKRRPELFTVEALAELMGGE